MEPLFAHGKKRISDSAISNSDARKISGEMGFYHAGQRQEFEKTLRGSVTREEIHAKLQEMVENGLPEEKAKSIMSKLGVDRKDLRTFRDISESKDSHNLERNEEAKRTENINRPTNTDIKNESSAGSKGIWSILKPKH